MFLVLCLSVPQPPPCLAVQRCCGLAFGLLALGLHQLKCNLHAKRHKMQRVLKRKKIWQKTRQTDTPRRLFVKQSPTAHASRASQHRHEATVRKPCV